MRNVKWQGKIVSFRKLLDGAKFIKARRRVRECDVCPLCKQVFTRENTTAVVLIISNQAGVPNRFVHTECLEDKTDAYAFRLIAEDYEQSKQYSDWYI